MFSMNFSNFFYDFCAETLFAEDRVIKLKNSDIQMGGVWLFADEK